MRAAETGRSLRYSRSLFLFYLLLLVWVPLPLGSNRVWSWSLLEVWVYCLGAATAIGWVIRPAMIRQHALVQARTVLVVLLMWLAYLCFQMVALPLDVLAFLAPSNAEWWLALSQALPVEQGRLVGALHSAQTEFLKHGAYVVFFGLTLVLVDSQRRLMTVIYVMAATAVFEAVYGLAANFMGDAFPFWRPTWYGHHWATGTFINKNHYAAHLSLGVSLMLGVCLAFISRQSARSRAASWQVRLEQLAATLLDPGYLRFGFLLILLTALFFSQSRGAFLSLAIAAGGLLFFGMYWRDFRASATRVSGYPSAERRFLPWLILLGLVAAVWLSSSGLFGRLSPSDLADTGRLVTWRITFSIWLDHWVFGVGNGAFQYVFTHYKEAALDGSLYDFAHNDHLQLLAEQGVIGSLLFLTVFLLCWRQMLVAYCKRNGSVSEQGLLLGIMIGVTAFYLHGFVDFNFHIPANALWFYTLLGLGLVSASRITRS